MVSNKQREGEKPYVPRRPRSGIPRDPLLESFWLAEGSESQDGPGGSWDRGDGTGHIHWGSLMEMSSRSGSIPTDKETLCQAARWSLLRKRLLLTTLRRSYCFLGQCIQFFGENWFCTKLSVFVLPWNCALICYTMNRVQYLNQNCSIKKCFTHLSVCGCCINSMCLSVIGSGPFICIGFCPCLPPVTFKVI